ncbi:MAG TPA: S53 family peptidase [Ktedonobacteraceae bacterium]|nr:S53 family peptidase [Ktedonobacteraceae bacterium]
MQKSGLTKRLLMSGLGVTLLMSLLCGAFIATSRTAHAATVAPASGVMSVHPLYRYAGKDTDSATFSCQQPGYPINCYTPQELLKAYDIQRVQDAGIKGKGQTIVIIDAFGYPTLADDLNVFDTTFGLPAAKLNIIYPNGQPVFDLNNADEVGWSGEIALDVESAHAVAPEATIDLVISLSDQDQDIQNALQYVVDHHLGNVLSQSYGEAESCVAPSILRAQHRAFAKAVAQGMTVFASSGDDGAAQPTCDTNSFIKSASSPASDPLVTSVGGTSLTATQPDGTYVSETAWNDEYGSSGGGYSTIYSRPFYQAGYVHNKGRGVPDVAYSGDVNNGLLIAWSGGDPTAVGDIYIFGGTSAGSPQWAAMTALVDSVFGRQGDINPLLYLFVAHAEYSKVFHDVTTGNNTVTETDSNGNDVNISGYNATRGWDAVTGLGSIDLGNAILGTGRSCWSHHAITY